MNVGKKLRKSISYAPFSARGAKTARTERMMALLISTIPQHTARTFEYFVENQRQYGFAPIVPLLANVIDFVRSYIHSHHVLLDPRIGLNC